LFVQIYLFFFNILETVQVPLHKIHCKEKTGGFKMSDLAATNCGTSCGCDDNRGGCDIIIILLLLCCCGGDGGFGFGGGRGGFGGGDCGCDIIVILLLLTCCC